MPGQGIHVARREGRLSPFMPGETMVWKVTGAETNGALDFSEMELDANVRTPEHVHHGNDESFYVLEGTIRFKAGTDLLTADAGSFVFIPSGTPHCWVNDGQSAARVLVLFTPGGMDAYFDEMRPLIPQLMVGLDDMSKVDNQVLEKAERIMQRYEYELVGPPLD